MSDDHLSAEFPLAPPDRGVYRGLTAWERGEPGATPETDQLCGEILADANFKDTNPKDAVGIAKAYASTIPRPVLWEVGVAMLEGALKYGRHNYRAAGVRASVYYDAAHRHLDDWWEGEDLDPASGLSHVTKAIAGLVVLRDAMMNDLMTDDRPPPARRGWLEVLNEKAAALLLKFPPSVRKAPHTRTNTETRH